jgi:DNA-binding MarR family transcriptional regulator
MRVDTARSARLQNADPSSDARWLSPTRATVLRHLEKGKYPSEVARELGVSRQAVSLHVRALSDAGLVEWHDWNTWERRKSTGERVDIYAITQAGRSRIEKEQTARQDAVRRPDAEDARVQTTTAETPTPQTTSGKAEMLEVLFRLAGPVVDAILASTQPRTVAPAPPSPPAATQGDGPTNVPAPFSVPGEAFTVRKNGLWVTFPET